MNIRELETPAILVRKNIMEQNLLKYQRECDKYSKKLWPMVKTHKSTVLCTLQKEIGADGFLCGTLDECEALCEKGFQNIMYAYPAAGEVSCRRAARLAKKCTFYVRIDSLEAAAMLNDAAKQELVIISYTIIVDCGLHRFGILPEKAAAFAEQLEQFEALRFVGISSHSGHVYGECDPAKIPLYAQEEKAALHQAALSLREAGFDVRMVTTGSTPTFRDTVDDDVIQIYHPGNYMFHDAIQIGNRTATENECALAVYATVISHPSENLFICDAGAKCLGLDQGAHGNASVQGYGYVSGHPELLVTGLSEEVGKLCVRPAVTDLYGRAESPHTDIKVGDRIMIIPNHTCSSANLTDYYIMIDENENVIDWIPVDIRGNRTKKIKV